MSWLSSLIQKPDRDLDVLLREWDICEAGIGRFDTLTFGVRGWAVSLLTAVMAGAMTTSQPLLILPGVGAVLAFWLVDALNKTYQRRFILRAGEIEDQIRSRLGQPPSGDRSKLPHPSLSTHFAEYRDRGKRWVLREVFRAAFEANVLLPYLSMLIAALIVWATVANTSTTDPKQPDIRIELQQNR